MYFLITLQVIITVALPLNEFCVLSSAAIKNNVLPSVTFAKLASKHYRQYPALGVSS